VKDLPPKKDLGRNKLAQLPAERGEFCDAISADSVDADLVQGFPLVGVVGGPRYNSRVDRMDACNEVFVDERHLLPEILRADCEERCDWIDMPGDFEHSGWNRRKNALDCFDDAMVERVYRAIRP